LPVPGDFAEQAAMRIALGAALEKLTARQRTVLVLRIFDDRSEAQAAQVLGCAVGTVKATMSQALAKLRDDQQLTGLLERKAR
jgi:RNA polymerase sigma factor (sigma-70 family)